MSNRFYYEEDPYDGTYVVYETNVKYDNDQYDFMLFAVILRDDAEAAVDKLNELYKKAMEK